MCRLHLSKSSNRHLCAFTVQNQSLRHRVRGECPQCIGRPMTRRTSLRLQFRASIIGSIANRSVLLFARAECLGWSLERVWSVTDLVLSALSAFFAAKARTAFFSSFGIPSKNSFRILASVRTRLILCGFRSISCLSFWRLSAAGIQRPPPRPPVNQWNAISTHTKAIGRW